MTLRFWANSTLSQKWRPKVGNGNCGQLIRHQMPDALKTNNNNNNATVQQLIVGLGDLLSELSARGKNALGKSGKLGCKWTARRGGKGGECVASCANIYINSVTWTTPLDSLLTYLPSSPRWSTTLFTPFSVFVDYLFIFYIVHVQRSLLFYICFIIHGAKNAFYATKCIRPRPHTPTPMLQRATDWFCVCISIWVQTNKRKWLINKVNTQYTSMN